MALQHPIRTWSSCLAQDPGEAAAGLTPSERRHALELSPPAAADFRAGRLAARRALRRLLGRSAETAVVRTRLGAPMGQVVGPCHGGRVPLSISHRGGRGAAAAAVRGLRVGIDLERLGEVTPDRLRLFLSESERRALGGLKPTTLWTLKEAAWKALALRPSTPFHALALHFGHSSLIAVSLGDRRWSSRARLTHPWPGWVLGTVVLHEERAS